MGETDYEYNIWIFMQFGDLLSLKDLKQMHTLKKKKNSYGCPVTEFDSLILVSIPEK